MGRPAGSPDRAKRRGRGEGSLERRGTDTWRLRVFVGTDPATNRPVQATRTIRARTRTEALRQLRAFAEDVAEGKVPTNHPSRDVASLLDRYVRHVETARGRSPRTVANYRQAATHLAAELGSLPLRKLTASHIDAYHDTCRAAGLAPGTIRLHHDVLSGALEQAVRWELVGRNVAKSATRPAPTRSRRRAPSKDDLAAVVRAADEDPDLQTAILVAVVTGVRRGELCGLRWSDLDVADAALTIERQWVPGEGGDVLSPPKGGKRRRISLGPDALAVLAMYRAHQEDRAQRLGVRWSADGWLLSRDGGVSHWHPKLLTAEVRDIAKRAGVTMTLHETRHHAATELVSAGVDVYTAAFRLGHDPTVLLRTYAHLLPAKDREAAAILDARWRPALESGRAEPPGP